MDEVKAFISCCWHRDCGIDHRIESEDGDDNIHQLHQGLKGFVLHYPIDNDRDNKSGLTLRRT